MPRGTGNTRERILEVALELFCEQGFVGTSMRDVGSRLHISAAALYYHFDNKDALLRALVDPLLDEIDDLITRPHELDNTAESRRRLLSRYLDILIRHRPLVRFVAHDPAVRSHPVVGFRLGQQKVLLQVLLGGKKNGASGTAVGAAALGALWQPVVDLDDTDLARLGLGDTIVDAAIGALRAALP